MLQGALDRIECLDRDLAQPVVGSLQDFKGGSLEELFRQTFQKIPGQVDHPELLVVVEQHWTQGGQLVALEIDGLEFG